MLTSNASVLEMTWLGVSVLGIAFALAFWAHVWASYFAVRDWIRRGWAVRWGPRHKYILGFLWGVALLLLVWLGFAGLGINAALNPPPVDPVRAAASERGGWLLTALVTVLLLFSAILFWVWMIVGRPRLASGGETPTISDLLEAATLAGRQMGHLIADDLQIPVATLDMFCRDAKLSESQRTAACEALDALDRVMARVRQLHREIRELGGVS